MNHEQLIKEMIAYYKGDAKRIQHFLKVYGFASYIGKTEKLDNMTLEILVTAAIVHDIGIKAAEKKYGSCSGKYQEMEGPGLAKKMLQAIGYTDIIIERVCFLVGHHHTYQEIEGLDYQILVEADFLVNIYEDNMDAKEIDTVIQRIFKTKTGIWLGKTMYQDTRI